MDQYKGRALLASQSDERYFIIFCHYIPRNLNDKNIPLSKRQVTRLQLLEIFSFPEFLKFPEKQANLCQSGNVCPGLVTSARTFYDTAESGRAAPSLGPPPS